MIRSEAKLAGAKHYKTGKSCLRGHVAKRQTSNGNCVDCDALKMRDTAGDAAYRLNNRERVMAANKAWYEGNKDRYTIYVRNRRIRMLGADGEHTKEDIYALFAGQNGRCAACVNDIATGYHVDHVMPLVLGGSNWPDNLQLLCAPCNLSKGSKHPEVWRVSAQMLERAA